MIAGITTRKVIKAKPTPRLSPGLPLIVSLPPCQKGAPPGTQKTLLILPPIRQTLLILPQL